MGTFTSGRCFVSAAIAAAIVLTACARDPVTGRRQLVLVSEQQEIAMGREAAQQVDESMGLVDDEELSAWIERLGMRLAASSERPDLPWRFRIVDSPVVNAFALPGGFIYVTRGILAYMDSEAALVGVLGHEVGHVTARHSVEQISRQQLAGLGLNLGTVFFPEARPFGDVLGGSLGLLFLKFGRDAERESDQLGVRYSLALGYDPARMASFFSVLGRLGDSSRDIPAWASTHPDPDEREATILRLAAEQTPAGADLEVGDEDYLRRLDGLVFGDNPREGFMKDQRFVHPELAFQFAVPEGWQVQNTRQAVYAASRDGAAALQLTVSSVAPGASAETHARDFFLRHRLETGTGERLRVGPYDAYRAPFRVLTRSGEIVGEAGFIEDGERIYELLCFTRPAQLRAYSRVFRDVIASFDRLRDRQALDIQPLRIRLYEVPRSMRFDEALEQAGSDPAHASETALMNDLEPADLVERGTLLKILRRGGP